MAESTAFIIVILSAVDKNFEAQLIALCRMWTTITENRSFFFLPKCSRSPKYFPTPPSFDIPSSLFTSSFASREVFEEKAMDDFWLFIVWPEATS